jgi:hypothetical protein
MDCTKFTDYGRFDIWFEASRDINLDSSDSDEVYTNDNTPSIIKTSDVETVKLRRKRIVIN